jgi:hypothetical protein
MVVLDKFLLFLDHRLPMLAAVEVVVNLCLPELVVLEVEVMVDNIQNLQIHQHKMDLLALAAAAEVDIHPQLPVVPVSSLSLILHKA